MTKAERIEAMARAIYAARFPHLTAATIDEHFEWLKEGIARGDDSAMQSTTNAAMIAARAAYDAADVEGMVREAAEAGKVAGIDECTGLDFIDVEPIVRRVCG